MRENNILCHDFIGKPDPISNLRPMRYGVSISELDIEKKFRMEKYKVQEWNNDFWTRHNKIFLKEKEKFWKENMMKNNNIVNKADRASIFYKDFLDRNWSTHYKYNIDWYKKNAYLTSLAVRVNVYRLLNRCRKL